MSLRLSCAPIEEINTSRLSGDWHGHHRFDSTCVLLAALVLASCSTSESSNEYSSEMLGWRAGKDTEFRKDRKNSPIKIEELDRFLPLAYYPPDDSFAVAAVLEPAARNVTVAMSGPAGQLEQMEQVGILRFSLNGRRWQMAAFLEGSGRLKVPFTDSTNGIETYKAGRYVNLVPNRTRMYSLDFNYAYHPSCYYNSAYLCPLPPQQNHVDTPIRAGERMRELNGQ